MFTTAGEAFLTIGASEGTGVSPTFSGSCARGADAEEQSRCAANSA